MSINRTQLVFILLRHLLYIYGSVDFAILKPPAKGKSTGCAGTPLTSPVPINGVPLTFRCLTARRWVSQIPRRSTEGYREKSPVFFPRGKPVFAGAALLTMIRPRGGNIRSGNCRQNLLSGFPAKPSVGIPGKTFCRVTRAAAVQGARRPCPLPTIRDGQKKPKIVVRSRSPS